MSWSPHRVRRTFNEQEVPEIAGTTPVVCHIIYQFTSYCTRLQTHLGVLFFFFINHNLAFVYTGNRNLKIFSYAQVREEFAGKCLGITCLSREGFLIFKRGPESLCNGDLKQHFFVHVQ